METKGNISTGTTGSFGGRIIPSSVVNLKEINIGKIGKLIITEDLQKTINYLHSKVGSTEWSGILFYKLTKGSIKDLKNLEFTAEFLYPMNIGSHAYTEFDYNEDVINAYDIYEEAINCSSGLCHSHHSMSAFFSGTDTSELKENCKNFNYYLSLIVNFDGKYCAKVGFYSASEVKTKLAIKDSVGKIFNKQITKTEESVLIGDLEIETISQPEWLVNRYAELNTKKPVTTFVNNGYRGYQSTLWPEDTFSKGIDYKDVNWAKKDKIKVPKKETNNVTQFISALINLDTSKKFCGLTYSLNLLKKLDVNESDMFIDAVDLNIEQIYCEIYPKDTMMGKFEEICEEAAALIEESADSENNPVAIQLIDLLYLKAVGEEVE